MYHRCRPCTLSYGVALRIDRARVSRILRKIYTVARRITRDGGGSGPWTFLVDPDPAHPKTARLRTILGLRPAEDLWVEFVFYPNKARVRNIIRRIWQQPQVKADAAALDAFISKREAGYAATVAYAKLMPV